MTPPVLPRNTGCRSGKQWRGFLKKRGGQLCFRRCFPILSEKIAEKNQEALLKDIEFPLAAVLAHMELCGFAVDSDGIPPLW